MLPDYLIYISEFTDLVQVEFHVDTTQVQSARKNIDWNSKKAGRLCPYYSIYVLTASQDDDDIETSIQVRLTRSSSMLDHEPSAQPTFSRSALPIMDVVDRPDRRQHGKTEQGDTACCRNLYGLFNCQACFHEVTDAVLSEYDEQRASVAHQVLSALQKAGSKGVGKKHIYVSVKIKLIITFSFPSRQRPVPQTRLCYQ